MQKISVIILATAILSIVMCSSSESPETSFEKFKQAACQGNVDEIFSRIDIKALSISNYKENNPNASDADIQIYLASPKYNEAINKFKENIKNLISQKDNDICKFNLIESKTEGNTAILHIQEKPDNPYLIYKYTFKKNGNRWLWASVDGILNEPIKLNSDTLQREYGSNSIASDQKYKGKVIEIKGKIFKVDKDVTGKVYIALGEKLLPDTMCYIKSSNIQKVSELKAGSDITLTGVCSGLNLLPVITECVF